MTETRLTRDRIETILHKMATTKVVVVGDAMLDVYLVGEVDRVSPEAPVPVVAVHASRHGLGGAANVAANVAALGAECRLVAVVGQDTRGTSVRTELDDLHLSTSYLVTDPGRPTTSKTRVVARGQQMLRIDEEIDNPISARVMEQLGAALERALRDADALLIEDYNKGTLVPQVIERALTLAKKRSLPVVVDPKFKNFFAYRGATIFKPNRRELELAMGAALDLAHPGGRHGHGVGRYGARGRRERPRGGAPGELCSGHRGRESGRCYSLRRRGARGARDVLRSAWETAARGTPLDTNIQHRMDIRCWILDCLPTLVTASSASGCSPLVPPAAPPPRRASPAAPRRPLPSPKAPGP